MTLIYSRTRARCRKALEHLFRVHSMEVLEVIVDCWRRNSVISHCSILYITNITCVYQEGSAAFELVDVLTSSAQNAVNMLCESISMRIPGLSERARKQTTSFNL